MLPLACRAQRGQGLLDSMLVLCASAALVALLAPAYTQAYGLSLDASRASQCRRAAAELHSATELAKATGESSEYSGKVSIPDGAAIAYDFERSAVVVSFASRDGPASFLVANDCVLSGSCEGACSYRVYYDSGCRIFLAG
ncbi:MAG: hypothetical protein WCX64_00710 [Candidatus Micrarchaeia archaeon]